MQKFFKYSTLTLCLWVLQFATTTATATAKKEKQAFDRGLIVLAGTSMTNALHEILKNFSQKNNISISSTFSSTEELANSIEDGDPANIFISEDPKRMRDLQRKGVLNVFSLSTLVKDKLVVIAPKEHYLLPKLEQAKSTKDKLKLLIENSLMAIPDAESDPAGGFIKQALEVMGLWKKSNKKTIKTDNTRRALYLAAQANNTAIVYKSDTYNEDNIQIIAEIPQKYYDRIIYQVAIVAEISKESKLQDAEAFVKYLTSDEVGRIFTKYGFEKM